MTGSDATDGRWLTAQFEDNRSHLGAVAYRLLGSRTEADDAVQEAWLRLNRADVSDVQNLSGWLTTVVSRVCLDMLRARRTRREEPAEAPGSEPIASSTEGHDPEHEALLADSVGLALLVVLDTLTPAERLAFVLHDMFAVPFDEIAPIVGRSSTATRQLARRARRRVQGTTTVPAADQTRQRQIVDAFFAAARGGDFDALLAVLDPDVVMRSDVAAVQAGAVQELRGAAAVAENFAGRAQGATLALIDGVVGLVWAPGGRVRVVFSITTAGARITAIDVLAEPTLVDELEVTPIEA